MNQVKLNWQGGSVLHIKHYAHISHNVRTVQKRVVNVYRLITRGTLEEKIMGLQKFKMSIANTVISQDNASLQSMGTDQLLNLFTLDKVRPPTCFCHGGVQTEEEERVGDLRNVCYHYNVIILVTMEVTSGSLSNQNNNNTVPQKPNN